MVPVRERCARVAPSVGGLANINDRSDRYGGPIANSARLLLDVMAAVTAEIGAAAPDCGSRR